LIIFANIGAPHIWGGMSALSLGGFALAMTYNAAVTGKITLQYSKINRAAQPRTICDGKFGRDDRSGGGHRWHLADILHGLNVAGWIWTNVPICG
jgi:hypothetical protein